MPRKKMSSKKTTKKTAKNVNKNPKKTKNDKKITKNVKNNNKKVPIEKSLSDSSLSDISESSSETSSETETESTEDNLSEIDVEQEESIKLFKNIKLKDKLKVEIDNFSMLIAGMRRTGKTKLLEHLYTNGDLGQFHIIMVFSKNPHNLDVYSEFLPTKLLFVGYDQTKIDHLKKKQEENPELRSLVIFDDCIDRKKLKNEEGIADMFSMGRHHNISIVYVTQDMISIGTTARKNLDYLILFKQGYGTELELLYKNYFMQNIPCKFKDFTYFCNEKLVDHHCLVMNIVEDSNRVEDKFYLYRANLKKKKIVEV